MSNILKPIRYTIATFCIAASVGCLGLWGWSVSQGDRFHQLMIQLPSIGIGFYFDNWEAALLYDDDRLLDVFDWRINSNDFHETIIGKLYEERPLDRTFRATNRSVWFPLWYPALVAALAAIAALRIGKRFTLKSALIGTTIVATLLGMAVAL